MYCISRSPKRPLITSLARITLIIALTLALDGASATSTESFMAHSPLPFGPSSHTVDKFHFSTSIHNHATIWPQLNYVQRVVIDTTEEIESDAIIIQHMDEDNPYFIIDIPDEDNKFLRSSKVYAWAPDAKRIQILKEPGGEEMNVVKLIPKVSDGRGNVLCCFTTKSLGTFYLLGEPKGQSYPIGAISAITIALLSAIAVLLTRS